MIIRNPKKININQKIYDQFVYSLDLHLITCPNCHDSSWSFHASYDRYTDFLGSKIRIKIVRVICGSCGKTHAILIESMIPFSCLNFDELIQVLHSHYFEFTDSSHFYYLKNKFSFISRLFYKDICLFNKRNSTILFVST